MLVYFNESCYKKTKQTNLPSYNTMLDANQRYFLGLILPKSQADMMSPGLYIHINIYQINQCWITSYSDSFKDY